MSASPVLNQAGICDPSHIEQALQVLYGHGLIVEIRAFQARLSGHPTWRPEIHSGYYDNSTDLARDVSDFIEAEAIYFTLNPVKPSMLSRAHNRLRRGGGKLPTTADHQILKRRWLLVDVDASRLAGISATKAEHEAAMALTIEIRDWLTGKGWPLPLVADSGNGAHLLYRIDLPNDAEALALVTGCLKALGLKFDAPHKDIDAAKTGDKITPPPCAVDQTVGNAARICKLYGTRACKGDHSPDRPHRLSVLTEIPAPVRVVTKEQMTALVASLPKTAPAKQRDLRPGYSKFDIQDWVTKHLSGQVGPAKEWQGTGLRWIFPTCPENSDHTDRSAWVAQRPTGEIAAGCQHDSCTWGWQELRQRYEPGCYDPKPQTAPKAAPPDRLAWNFLPQTRKNVFWLGAFSGRIGGYDLSATEIDDELVQTLHDGAELVRQGGTVPRPNSVSHGMMEKVRRRILKKHTGHAPEEASDDAVEITRIVQRKELNSSTFDITLTFAGKTANLKRLSGAALATYFTIRSLAIESLGRVLLPPSGKNARAQWDRLLGPALDDAEVIDVDPEESVPLVIRQEILHIINSAEGGETGLDLIRGNVVRTATGMIYINPRFLVSRVRASLSDDRISRADIVDAIGSLNATKKKPLLADKTRPRVWAFPPAKEETK